MNEETLEVIRKNIELNKDDYNAMSTADIDEQSDTRE